MKQQFFISGLPRSGSTLLASLLSQNPKFYTDIASPVNAIVEAQLHIDTFGFNQILTPAKTKKLIENTFEVMYGDNDKEVIFDTNRCWSGKLEILHEIFPETKVICCVRDIKSILNSFEHIYRQNPYQSNSAVYGQDNVSVYSRSHNLLSPTGIFGLALNYLKQGIHSSYKDMLYIVEYDDLVEDTEAVLESIYEVLGLEPFEHDLNNLKNIENTKIVDDSLFLPNLHTVRKVVARQEIPNYLPHDLASSVENMEYWRWID
jgi:sulfotransferase